MFWEKKLKITLLSNIAFRLNQVFRFESRAFKTTYKTLKQVRKKSLLMLESHFTSVRGMLNRSRQACQSEHLNGVKKKKFEQKNGVDEMMEK